MQFAKNIPLDQIDPAAIVQHRSGPADSPLYFICQGGNRSQQACKTFLDAGFSNVISVDGGTSAWAHSGRPTVRGKKAVSLERQVRIAAGTLVLTGVICGFLIHPGFFGLSAFVGAGFVLAGVTDTCGMGLVLARMPWNRCAGGECAGKGS